MSTKPLHRDIEAKGVRLRVVEYGQGPSLLLLHGLFMDNSTWQGVAVRLSTQFRVVCPDLPGFGLSEKPSAARFPYGIQAFADGIVDLFAGLGLGRAVVVGHGLGGAIAITLAARHPELIAKLVLVDSLCYASRTDVARRLATLPLVGGFAFKQMWGRIAFRAYFKDAGADAKAPGSLMDHYYEIFNTPAARASALATLRATGDTRAVVAAIARLTSPTLVLWGSSDSLYPAGLGHRMAREIRGARFQLLDTGHVPQEQAPQAVAAALERFCLPRP